MNETSRSYDTSRRRPAVFAVLLISLAGLGLVACAGQPYAGDERRADDRSMGDSRGGMGY